MNEQKQSLFAAAVVVVGAVGVIGGNTYRSYVDIGTVPEVTSLQGRSLVAARNLSADPTETDYFESMAELLKDQYVDPNVDSQKLAIGAVRGMVAHLNDLQSLFMDPDEFRVFRNAQRGIYEGIGVDLVYKIAPPGGESILPTNENEGMRQIQMPKVVVGRVVPGSSAAKAGLKPGDVIDSIDGRWVVNTDVLEELRKLQEQVTKGTASAKDLNLKREEVRKMIDKSMVPLRARDQLMTGTEGSTRVQWLRSGKTLSAAMQKGKWLLPLVSTTPDGAIAVKFGPGVDKELATALRGKTTATLDLRGESYGEFPAMKAALAKVARKGTLGFLVRQNGKLTAQPLVVSSGQTNPPKLSILVDSNTSGAAEIFALALASKGAKLQGSKTAGDRSVVEITPLPDGGGYTMVTAKFQANEPKGVAK